MKKSLSIVVPVYNDWASLFILLSRLNDAAKTLGNQIFVIVVDDGSTDQLDDAAATSSLVGLSSLCGVELVHLCLNIGHQRAIAVGLCIAVEEHETDAILVMDGDGEDPPESIGKLLECASSDDDFCVVAQRRKRTESFSFKVSYLVYKGIFRLVTGKQINFGNFSLTSRAYARRLVMVPDLWDNFAAAVLRSRLPVRKVLIDRGRRYAGVSKMNFVSLIVHGMSGMSVYAETIFVRLLALTVGLFFMTIAAITLVLVLRLFYPQHATPGWATTVSFGMLIILAQAFFTVLSSMLMLLNARVQRQILPIKEFRHYIALRRMLVGDRPRHESLTIS